HNALILAFLWGSFVGLLMWFIGGWSLGVLGAEAGAQHEGTVYLKAASVGMPFFALIYAGNASQQGAGDTRTPMITGILVNIANILIAYTLINGAGPAPKLNVLGSGGGFAGGAMIGCVLVLSVLILRRRGVHWRPLRQRF